MQVTSATIADFDFFYFEFWELVEPDFFPGTLERLRTTRASKKLAPQFGRRAAPADLRRGERAARNPIGSPSADLFTPPCGNLSARAHTRPRPSPRYFPVLRFFGAHSASALRRRRTSGSIQALASSPAATCRYGRDVSPFPSPSADDRPHKGKKRGCRLEPRSASPGRTRNILVRASPDANYRDRVTPRTSHSIHFFYLIFFYF